MLGHKKDFFSNVRFALVCMHILRGQCQTPMIVLGHRKKGYKMFVYLITTTDGFVSRVVTDGDPTDHPAFFGRVANVETLGVEGELISLV